MVVGVTSDEVGGANECEGSRVYYAAEGTVRRVHGAVQCLPSHVMITNNISNHYENIDTIENIIKSDIVPFLRVVATLKP